MVCKLNPKNVVGLRFFNVYGLNEIQKKKMISTDTKIYLELKKKGYCNIFEEYGGYKKGFHSRDFISVENCNDVALWFKDNKKKLSSCFLSAYYCAKVMTGLYRLINKLSTI